jgi:hypothetical protein
MGEVWPSNINQWSKASSSKPPDAWIRPQAWAAKRQAASNKLDKALELGYNGIMSTKLSTNNLFRTFETEKEAAEWINSHSLPEEKRLLWLGFAFGCNYAANQVNKKFILKKKE